MMIVLSIAFFAEEYWWTAEKPIKVRYLDWMSS